MRVTARKRGNTAVVRIPTSVLRAAGMKIGSTVEVYEENGCVIVAVNRSVCDLQSLIDAITPENVHAEINFGRPVGREALS